MKALFIFCFTIITFFAFSQTETKLINLGPKVNTKDFTECFPCFSADGRTLFFSRNLDESNRDIFYTTLDENNEWTPAKPIPELNNNNPNCVFYATPDGEMLYLSGNYEGEGSEEGLSVTHRLANGWSAPERIHFDDEALINSHNVSITLSSDNQVMILCLEDKLYDYFVSFRKDENSWSAPVKLDTNINTNDYEYSPVLAPDNRTLYFSSGGHGGLGLNDIFKTTRLDDTWLKWSDPENLGAPINSPDWESFFTLSARGDKAIVYSLKEGSGDLFEVALKEELKPQPTLLLSGKVINKVSGNPIEAEIVFEDLSTGAQIGLAKTNPNTGEYKIVLTSGKKYALYAKVDGYFPVSENVDLMKIDTYSEQKKDLFMVPIEVGQNCVINCIFFEFGKATLMNESAPELNRLVTTLKEYPNMVIQVSGHTDNVGSETDNQKLSEERAVSVRSYLIQSGIDGNRIIAKGFGELQPVDSNETERGRQLNRRVEFKILKK